mgnify:FL=1|jgi:hypothetical protein
MEERRKKKEERCKQQSRRTIHFHLVRDCTHATCQPSNSCFRVPAIDTEQPNNNEYGVKKNQIQRETW